MKRAWTQHLIIVFLILLFGGTLGATRAEAACNWTLNPANGMHSMTYSCGIDGQSIEYYDYSSSADDATNGYVLTVPTGYTLTINSGAVSNTTTLGIGSINLTGGTVSVGSSYAQMSIGSKCYVVDSDGDLYSPTPTTCAESGGAGYIRKNKLSATTVDCGDGSADAKPGQTSFFTGTFVNGVNGSLTHDWNCDGVETKEDSAIYTCASCTNGSGYASTRNTTTGFITAVPACNVSGTYYTVTNSTCQDPAVLNCNAVSTNAAKTEACK